MKRYYRLLKKHGVVLLICVFLSVSLYAAEETARAVKRMSEEEFIPAKEVLMVKYVQIDKPHHISVRSLRGVFKGAKGIKVSLDEQDEAFPHGGGSVSSIDVKAIHNGITIYFQISWKDPTKNARAIAVQEFRDAVALMFPLGVVDITPAEHFSPRMGDREKPVNIWHWKADWEADLLAKDGLEDMQKRYPNMHDDFYSNPYKPYNYQEVMTDVEHLSGGRSANNLLSQPERGRTVEDLNAEGFGTLTTQDHQDVNGCSKYKDGIWTVIMYRSLITSEHDDIQFSPGGKTYFNIAVWDGGKKERNGQKNISKQWHPIIVEQIAFR